MYQYHDYQIPDHLYISLRITSIKAPMPVLAKSRIFVMLSHYDHWLVSKTACLNHVRQLCAVYLSTFLLAHHHHSSVGEVKSEGPDSSDCTTACVSLHKLLSECKFLTERVCIGLIGIAPLRSNTCFDSAICDHFDVHC